MLQLTHTQKLDILEQVLTAEEIGDEAEADRLIRLIPLPAHLAKAFKESFGKEYVLQSGYDLSEAEAQYGHGWLER